MEYAQRVGRLAVLLAATSAGAAMAQAPAVWTSGQSAAGTSGEALPSRLAGDWRSGVSAVISTGSPLLQGAADLGPAPPGTYLQRMLLLLEPSPAQSRALDAELAKQIDPTSSEYHRWLTPSAFADAYANSPSDVAAVVSWLQSAGFEVAPLPVGRGWIEFSGTVAQLEPAFQVQVRSVATVSGERFALAGAIAVPAALRPVIRGIVSLDGVVAAPALTPLQPVADSPATIAANASVPPIDALTPQTTGRLLHLDRLHSAGVNGAGETIAIPARSNVRADDLKAFRTMFGLPSSPLDLMVNGPEPGRTSDEAEAMLSASWAGAAAPGAQVLLVPAATTNATDGLDLSLAAIVDGSLANTVAVGFSACESVLSETHQAFYAAVYRQASAQGMAIVAASDDNGPSACMGTGTNAAGTAYDVNALASTPWNTAVGVAALSNGSGTGGSALTGWAQLKVSDPAFAGGGGSSALYSAPAWQPLPARDSGDATTHYARLLPDLALPAAVDSGVNHGLSFCLSAADPAPAGSGGCHTVRSGGSAAAAAIFAGIAALVASKNGPQGNLAPHLYDLSRRGGIFEDIEQGSARLFCTAGRPGCDASGQIGFSAGPGFDMATGLGSVDAQKLVSEWARPEATGTGTTNVVLTVAPTVANSTYNPMAQITFTASVSSTTGGTTPTGTVSFFNKATNANVSSTPSALDANGNATLTIASGLVQGGNNITANYSGDSNYASQSSQPVTVTIQPSTTSMTVAPSTTTPAAGSTITVVVTMTVGIPPAGTVPPSGKVTLNVDGLANSTASLVTAGGTTTATFSLVVPTVGGAHNLQAIYPGDANYTASTSPAVSITVAKGATVTALTAAPPTLTPGVTETLTATIVPANAASGVTYTITGTVSFYDGKTLLGTSTISSNAATLANVTLSPAVVHTITAVYSGDTSWLASTSNAITLQSALLPDTVTLAVNINTVGPGQIVSLIATVTPLTPPAANIEQNPTGNVIFYNGTTVIGTVGLSPTLNNASTATLTTGALPGGQNVLTAFYVGDLFFAPGTSNAVTIDVQDFSIAPSPGNPPTNLNIVQGSSGAASFVVTGLGGFNNQVQVVCAVPTQDNMTCQASPQQVTPTATVTFTVQTFAAGGTVASNTRRAPWWPRAAGGGSLALLALLVLPVGRRARIFGERSRPMLAFLLLLAGLAGAGMGCSSTSTPPQATGTPLGVATLKITATAYVDNTVINHSVYLTVNVLPPASAATIARTAAH